ncbi:MAG: lipoate--protein ligase family protein [Candidatus Omnitrophica bacterium]|nr:lipoate--protein ligase family protein [Candidatus Omnitrophota bacterium]
MIEYLDLSFPSPHPNLACDEALLDFCEEGYPGEILRFWQSSDYFVVLGYSNKIQDEVNINSCSSYNIPILRRPSGGGTVLQGPGCLNYSLILNIDKRPALKTITSATEFIMRTHQKAVIQLTALENIRIEGVSDLALEGLKFSGNAQRRKKDFMLFHGTFLLDMDISAIEKYLSIPAKQPAYRTGRTHEDFLTNLGVCSEKLKQALQESWKAYTPFPHLKSVGEKIESLVQEKYSRIEWNEKF